MDTTEQETPRHKSMKSELISHQLQIACKKTRSNSVNGDRDNEEKSSSDEATESKPAKLDFKQLRSKFEKPQQQEVPPPNIYKKRSSIQTTSINTFTNSLNNTLATKVPPPVPVKSKPFLKARSSSPPPTDETNNISTTNVPLISLNNKLDPPPIEEQDNPSSPLPTLDESSSISENENNENRKSVQSIRAFFNEQKTVPFNQPMQVDRTNHTTGKLPVPDFLPIPRQPPSRLPPSPEKYIKSQLSSLHSAPSFETVDSVTGDSSHSSNPNLSPCNSSDVSFTDEEEDFGGAERRIKLRKCLEEVHATEKTYVSILYVLAVKLTVEMKNTCDKDENLILLFNNTYKPLLGNIQQIYQLHHDIILPEIEEYITGHSIGNMWSVLEKNFKVIEVLYKNYYVTYYDTQGKLDDLCKTHSLINEAMLKCQVHLGNLYPITQLNCPNQRLLRYILCMKTYIKYLDDHSAEYKHSRSIHDELDRIAVRCEEELVVSAAQLNELKERLDNKFECIKDHRKLLWHGPLKKQSPRRHSDIAHRYMILFSDCILVCGEESGRKLEIKRELSMRGITIDYVQGGRVSIVQNNDQPNNGIVYFPFRVNAVEKSYEFVADKESDREIWVKKIRQASEDYNKRNSTIEIRQSGNYRDEQKLGIRAPAWINDVDVTRCQNCNNRFRTTTLISSRRHHCRSCGRCICGSCSTKKVVLEYCKTEGEVRVCDACYTHFTGMSISKNTSIWPKATREIDQTILFGDFRTINSGIIIWIALQEDFQLHIYGGKLDQAEEYAIKLPELLDIQLESDTRTFTLRETTKTHTFTIDPTHQIFYEKNDLLDDKRKNSDTKLIFYTNLWLEAIQLARSTTLPEWYTRKRNSADSGVSNDG